MRWKIVDQREASRQFERWRDSGWSKSEVPNSRSLTLAIDALEAIRAACEACEKHRDPLYGFSPLELEILAILGIELGSKKAVFEWCPKCKFYKNCYGDPDAINPKYLEPRCGEGPVLEEIGG